MRIAQVSPLAEAVPPRLYGGTERVVSWLTEALVYAGHDVTLFASSDSLTTASLVPIIPQALRLAGIRDHVPNTLLMLDEVRRRADEFDVIHFHVDMLHYPLFEQIAHKCITTLHGRLDLPHTHGVYRRFSTMPLVSISDAQRFPMPAGLNWAGTIHHGLPSNLYDCGSGAEGYLLFLGRISPEKRPDRAIEIARRTGIRLKIAAKVDTDDESYFRKSIAALLDDPLIDFVGEVNESQKHLLGNARALVFPIDWPEPFGLVMIEAMAAGTPVIAWPVGSVPEVLKNGLTGALVQTIEEAVCAARAIDKLDRRLVRAEFERRFTAAGMAAKYVKAYEQLLCANPKVGLPNIPSPGLALST